VVVAQSPDSDTNLRAIGGDWSQAAWGQGMDITIVTSSDSDDQARELLRAFGMPFRQPQQRGKGAAPAPAPAQA